MEKNLVVVLSLFLVMGCSSVQMAEKMGEVSKPRAGVVKLGSVSCALDEATLKDALKFLPSTMNIVYSTSLREKLVTLEVEGVSYMEYLYSLSRVVGCRVSRHGSVWVLQDSKSERLEGEKGITGSVVAGRNDSMADDSGGDDFTCWIDLDGWRQEEIAAVWRASGLNWVSGDLWLYRGSLSGALDLLECVDMINANRHVDYYFEIFFVSSDFSFDFGASDSIGLDLNWRQSFSKGMSQNEWSALASVALSSMVNMSRGSGVKCVAGVVRENVPYMCRVGDSVPYVKRSVSDAGTVSDLDVVYETLGLNVSFLVKGARSGIVELKIDSNDVSGYNNGYPIKHGSNVQTTYSVNSADMRYVGSLWVDSRSHGLLSLSSKIQMWDVFCRVERLSYGQYMRKDSTFLQKKVKK